MKKGNNNKIFLGLIIVMYLFNIRNYSTPYSAKIKGKAIVSKQGAKLYLPQQFEELENYLKNSKNTVIIDNSSIIKVITNINYCPYYQQINDKLTKLVVVTICTWKNRMVRFYTINNVIEYFCCEK